MGSGASKSAAQSTIRKFPNRAPGSAVPPPPPRNAAAAAAAASRRQAPKTRPKESITASFLKDETIREDGSDPHAFPPDSAIQPDLAERLREIGVVQPNPTYSPSSTASPMPSSVQQPQGGGPVYPSPSSNPVLAALEARERLQREAEEEFETLGLSNSQGRRFLQASMLRDVLVMRERGASEAEIEDRFHLKKGVLKTLGPRGLYKPTSGAESAP